MFRMVLRVIGIVLLLGLLAAGGYAAYQAGVAQGIAQAPEVAEAFQQGAVLPPAAGFGYPYGYHHFSPFGLVCGSVLFLFVFFGLLRMVVCGISRRTHGGKATWQGGPPAMFEEWHKRAHEAKPADETAA